MCDCPIMSVDTINCANCNVVISEVLAFIRNKHDVMDNESLIRICVSAFSVEEIDEAKILLCSTTTIGKRLKSRRKDKKQKDLEDMIAVFKTIDPDKLPVFVAYDLHKLPPVCFDHVDVTKILKDLLILRAELNDIKENFVTKNDLQVALKENNVIQSSSNQLQNPIFHSNVNKIRGGGYNLNSGPFGLSPQILPQHSQLIDSDSRSLTQPISDDDGPKYRSLVHSHAHLQTIEESAISPINSTLLEKTDDMNRNLIQSTQCNKTVAEVLVQGEWPKNCTKDGWTLVQNKKPKNRFEGNTGTASPNANFKFRAADSKIPLFITNVDKETTEKDICDYIQNKTQEIVQLQKINMKSERPYNAFKLFVSKYKLNKFLDDKIWPEGIRFRQFIYFKNKIIKVNKQNCVENITNG
ncbi:hypothetical protein HF086_006476 [Spodoptera exigua]|uniref:Mutant cadherin n=1 Tax=Spodoptera exigua TaxID=7107 RepID=A0A922MKM1_SPOEX|nr:hypothetical protein HF086_006476 [Spodoptera exigua]